MSYSNDLMRCSLLPSLIRLKGNLNQLSKDSSVPFPLGLAIKSLAHDAEMLDDLLVEYIDARESEEKK